MKTDVSAVLFTKYFTLENPKIEITLKDRTVLIGIFVGYFRGDELAKESFVKMWHFSKDKNADVLDHQLLDLDKNQIIQQKDILQIHFFEDDSVMNFTE